MGARPYDPALGRFLAVDPVDGGSLNNYDYAGQDPINGYDLDGSMLANPEQGVDASALLQILYEECDTCGGGSGQTAWSYMAGEIHKHRKAIGLAAVGVCVLGSAGTCAAVGFAALGATVYSDTYEDAVRDKNYGRAAEQVGIALAFAGADKAMESYAEKRLAGALSKHELNAIASPIEYVMESIWAHFHNG